MTYIIAEPCVSTCDTACVEVCPVDCIHGPDDKEGAGVEAKVEGFDHFNFADHKDLERKIKITSSGRQANTLIASCSGYGVK